MQLIKISLIFILLIRFVLPQTGEDSAIPDNCKQLVLVLTDSAASSNGFLFRYERFDDNGKWIPAGDTIPVVLGRNGLGWGRGLNKIDSAGLPVKIEGDGRSPAGVFRLSSAFGYADKEKMKGLKIPYIHITKITECIDDVNSEHYNKILLRDDKADWHSSEKMFYAEIWYEQGVLVDHNVNPVVKGAGSCIFLHNWSKPDETTSGCTEMAPEEMKKIIYWLDSSANPVLVQLTKNLYKEYIQTWQLP